MRIKVIRPDLSKDRWGELEGYLLEQWQRAHDSRTTQLDSKYEKWIKGYEAVPREAERNFPWPKSSNLVIPLVRMYVDTFVARTLNIIFATKPLYEVSGVQADLQDPIRHFLNKRALGQWEHYELVRSLLNRGCKTGSVFSKTLWKFTSAYYREETLNGSVEEREVVTYAGPNTKAIPFEDFAVYPITANNLGEAEIVFHRIRQVREAAMRQFRQGDWKFVTEDDIKNATQRPADIKREGDQIRSGVVDAKLEEMQTVECHLLYDLGDGRECQIIATIIPAIDKMVDVYYNPYPPHIKLFRQYTPYPREDFIYGDSMCQMLAGFQEEISQIHNDRRNNSLLSSTVMFKRKNGARVPNPSSSWYPGKVWDLDEMDDLDVLSVGRNYGDQLQEEEFSLMLAERVIGQSAMQQGASQGSMDRKRGVYNTQGTLSVIAEGNQRQDTNIRDIRNVIGAIAHGEYLISAKFGAKVMKFTDFPANVQAGISQALSLDADALEGLQLEVAASNAGANKEVAKANLYQLAQVMGQYGTTVQQMSMHLLNPQLNPGLRKILEELVAMHKWIAKRLLYAYEQPEGEELLPDVTGAVALATGGGEGNPAQAGAGANGGGMAPGPTGPPPEGSGVNGLQALLGA